MDKMKPLFTLALILSTTTYACPVLADPPAQPVEVAEPAPVVAPLQKSQPAPFTGVLFSPEAVAQVVAEKDTAEKELQLAIKHQIDLDAVQLEYRTTQLTSSCKADKSILMARIESNEKQINTLNAQLKSASGGIGSGAWFGIGIGAGVVATVVTVLVVTQATN